MSSSTTTTTPSSSPTSWGPTTTASTISSTFAPSIHSRTILITGVNPTGLGHSTASALATQSPSLIILTGRTPAKLDQSLHTLRTAHPTVTFKPLLLDLSSQASVRAAAAQVLSWPDVPAIDIVINNAGVMNIQEKTLSAEGIEMHFATNHVGHFLFTNLIMGKILAGTQPRIVNVSSVGAFVSPVRFSDLTWSTPLSQLPAAEAPNVAMLKMANLEVDDDTTYIPMGAYGMSKTANILFSVGLNKRLGERFGVRSFAVHPGEVMTELQRSTDKEWLAKAMEARAKAGHGGFKSLDEGAATAVRAATDPGLELPGPDGQGTYLSDCRVSAQVPGYALDKGAADRLWEVSEELVGEKFAW